MAVYYEKYLICFRWLSSKIRNIKISSTRTKILLTFYFRSKPTLNRNAYKIIFEFPDPFVYSILNLSLYTTMCFISSSYQAKLLFSTFYFISRLYALSPWWRPRKFRISYFNLCQGGTAPPTQKNSKISKFLCSISKLSTSFWKIIYACHSKLSKEIQK